MALHTTGRHGGWTGRPQVPQKRLAKSEGRAKSANGRVSVITPMTGPMSDRLGRYDLGIEGMEVEQRVDGEWHLASAHSGLDVKLPIESEFAGPRHVVHVFPVLNFALETKGLVMLDALDNDLHADLVDEVLSLFRREDTNSGNAQLICFFAQPVGPR